MALYQVIRQGRQLGRDAHVHGPDRPTRNYAPGCELPHLQNAAASVEAMARIADAVSTGDLLPGEAAALARVVENYLQALAAHGFDQRLTRLEGMAVGEPESGRTIELPAGPPPSVEKSL